MCDSHCLDQLLSFRSMRYQILSVLALFLVSGCAYTTEKQIQEITIETPGADNARCEVIVDGIPYDVRPPETTTIFKSEEDLIVDCKAPGNRDRRLVISPQKSSMAMMNASTAMAGLIWDKASGALYRYPERVIVDFTGVKPKPYGLPQHYSEDILLDHTHRLEEISTRDVRLNSDLDRADNPLQRRESPGSVYDPYADSISDSLSKFSEEDLFGAEAKGDLQPKISVDVQDFEASSSADQAETSSVMETQSPSSDVSNSKAGADENGGYDDFPPMPGAPGL